MGARQTQTESKGGSPVVSESEWLRLGYLLIVLGLLARWIYLASGLIELSQDEAYQWLWSKHLALAYFSKPLGIAFLQRAGTLVGGDTGFGVRFFSPVITAALSLMVMRFVGTRGRSADRFLGLDRHPGHTPAGGWISSDDG